MLNALEYLEYVIKMKETVCAQTCKEKNAYSFFRYRWCRIVFLSKKRSSHGDSRFGIWVWGQNKSLFNQQKAEQTRSCVPFGNNYVIIISVVFTYFKKIELLK